MDLGFGLGLGVTGSDFGFRAPQRPSLSPSLGLGPPPPGSLTTTLCGASQTDGRRLLLS